MAVSGALGLVVERVLILPVYGQHLKQILMTTGGLIVAEQTLYALWGPQIIPMPLPTSLRGSFKFNTNGYPIQDFYLTKVAKRPDGKFQTEIVQKVFENYGDRYAKDCKAAN